MGLLFNVFVRHCNNNVKPSTCTIESLFFPVVDVQQ